MIQHGKNLQQYAKHRIAKVKLGKMLRLEVQPGVPGNTGKPRQSPSKNATEINSSWQSLSLSTWAEISRKVGWTRSVAQARKHSPPPPSKGKVKTAQDATRFVDSAVPGQEGVDLPGKVGSARPAPQPFARHGPPWGADSRDPRLAQRAGAPPPPTPEPSAPPASPLALPTTPRARPPGASKDGGRLN